MFAPHCPSCDRRVLLGTDRVLGLRSAAHPDGTRHRVDLRCRCGRVLSHAVARRAGATSL